MTRAYSSSYGDNLIYFKIDGTALIVDEKTGVITATLGMDIRAS